MYYLPVDQRRYVLVATCSIALWVIGLTGCLTATAPGKYFSYKGKKSANESVLTFDYTNSAGDAVNKEDLFEGKRPYFKTAYQFPEAFGFTGGSFSSAILKLSGTGATESLVTSGTTTVTLSAKAAVRNQILYELMGVIDDYYGAYTDRQLGLENNKNLFADVFALGTSAASTAAGGEQLKTVLSAISTGVQGGSSDIDKDVFQKASLQAVKESMDTARHEVAIRIYLKMRNDEFAYPLEAALRDVIRYYYAGTLTAGLEQLSATANETKVTSQSSETQANPASAAPTP
jgi:hypothetical protein